MGYVDELLSAHAALAAELEAEPEEALARHAARRRGQTREEQEKPENDARGVSAEETPGVQPSVMRHSRFEGGLCADFSQSLETQGVSGAQTQRSMREISRFFERDARRYGG